MRKPKRGRPPLPEAKRRSKQVHFRLCAVDHATLSACNVKSGRSLSAEAEYRIVRSFRDDEVLAELREIRAMLDGGGR